MCSNYLRRRQPRIRRDGHLSDQHIAGARCHAFVAQDSCRLNRPPDLSAMIGNDRPKKRSFRSLMGELSLSQKAEWLASREPLASRISAVAGTSTRASALINPEPSLRVEQKTGTGHGQLVRPSEKVFREPVCRQFRQSAALPVGSRIRLYGGTEAPERTARGCKACRVR